jgi:4-carboxymuconolactone decarboxylase
MPEAVGPRFTIAALSTEERELVRFAAVVAAGDEGALREAAARAAAAVRPVWVEEMLLQSYLFSGFPRALNAMREWRRLSGQTAPAGDSGESYANHDAWKHAGESTCATVYGRFYERLRNNIRLLHPALDAWMIVEGYGKVLSRPGLDLARRELCIVAACAATGQERQLHSHLHGALNAGAGPRAVSETLLEIEPLVGQERTQRYLALWKRVFNTSDVH